jgi:hypothetical protein
LFIGASYLQDKSYTLKDLIANKNLHPERFICLDNSYSLLYYLRVNEKYLKASEVAKRYSVSSVSVRSWIKSGLLPNARLEENIAGSVWLIPESDLEGFVKPEQGRPAKPKE